MNIDLTNDDLNLLKLLLDKELDETRVEIRHASINEYKTCLKERERLINSLYAKVAEGITGPSRVCIG